MLTAEYGGTGGRPIESYMVVEEPDIEIGAGVSSKGLFGSLIKRTLLCSYTNGSFLRIAISRRMATDKGGNRGPQSSRSQQERFRRQERASENNGGGANSGAGGSGGNTDRDSSNANNPAVPPAVPGFGFSFPGMPMFPPGFMMGGTQTTQTTQAGSTSTTQAQPPPPGQTSSS